MLSGKRSGLRANGHRQQTAGRQRGAKVGGLLGNNEENPVALEFRRSIMMRSLFRLLAITALMSMSLISASFADNAKATKSTEKMHRVAIQVNENDPAVMNLALNNATNIVE